MFFKKNFFVKSLLFIGAGACECAGAGQKRKSPLFSRDFLYSGTRYLIPVSPTMICSVMQDNVVNPDPVASGTFSRIRYPIIICYFIIMLSVLYLTKLK